MKIVIAADSFKGSLTTLEAGASIREGVLRAFPDASIQILPVADGGEGTVSTVISGVGGRIEYEQVMDTLGREISAPIGYLNSDTAIIEMASACGITLVQPGVESISAATTYGLGEQLLRALDAGCKTIYVGLGGSATNDGGAGFAQALGYRFYDNKGELIPNGAISLLNRPARVDEELVDARVWDARIIAITDVNNPLLGKQGCAHVFGPQKGMTQELVEHFDRCMEDFAQLIARDLGREGLNAPGTGAGGGMGMGIKAFAGAELRPGIGTVLDVVSFDEHVRTCDLVITGEGRLDAQSVHGKVPIGVAERAAVYGKMTVAVVGSLGKGYQEAYAHGISAMESAVHTPMPLEEALQNAPCMLSNAAERLMRAMIAGRQI